jgi:hypothetical protein
MQAIGINGSPRKSCNTATWLNRGELIIKRGSYYNLPHSTGDAPELLEI